MPEHVDFSITSCMTMSLIPIVKYCSDGLGTDISRSDTLVEEFLSDVPVALASAAGRC